MKIRKLHINRFGHFTERDLDFPGNGLQVIYGPNEAGKTTLLEFLRGLLFDFDPRTPYDFGGEGDIAGVATLEMHDGRSVELRRRKGNKDKVSIKINGVQTELDDSGWLKLLDHADQKLFESVFAFGLDQLSQGEACLKHESLQSALIGGGLGSSCSPDEVIHELSHQADELFKKAGRKPTINAILDDLKKMGARLKELSLRPEKYLLAVENAKKVATHANSLHAQVDALRRKHAQIEKRVRAWPKWWELQQRRNERAELGDVPVLPANARLKYGELNKELKSLGEDRAKQSAEIEKLDRQLGTLLLNPHAVSFAGEIRSCVELRQSFLDARDDLPKLRQERENLRLEITRELHEARPGWGHDELRAFSVDVATSTEIQRFSDASRDHQTSRTTLIAKRDSDQANLNRSRQELDAISESKDVTILTGILADEAEYVAERKQLEKTRSDLKKMQSKLATQVRQLAPPLSSEAIAPHKLSVPRVETVTEFKTRQADLAELLRTAKTSADEVESEIRTLNKSLDTALKSGSGVPSLEKLDDARTRRDDGWELIRRRYINAELVDADVAAWLGTGTDAIFPDEYVHAVKQADRIADLIYENANEVAEREGLRRNLVDIESRLNEKRQLIACLQAEQDRVQTEWMTLWQTCGIEPLTPEAMQGWLKKHEEVCTTVRECDDLTAELTSLGEQVDAFEQRLSVACDEVVEDVSSMLAWVRRTVEVENHRQESRKSLLKEVRRLEVQLARYDKDIQSIQDLEAASNAEWRSVLNRLKLPSEWDAELARTVIDKLKTTRVRLNSLPGEDARIAAMESRVGDFNRRSRELCEALAPELLRDPAELAVSKLDEQVALAVQAKRDQLELSQKLTVLRNEFESSGERLQNAEAERDRLFESASVTHEVAFLEVVTRNEKVACLDAEIAQLRSDIGLIRAGDDPTEFEQSLLTSELSILQGQESDLRDQVKAAETMRKQADGDEALARQALSQLDGSDEAAMLRGQLASKRSQLTSEVDRYMPLIYARHLLNAAVSRFEKENQPEMIATVSRLFDQMTEGRYVEFHRTGGSKKNILVRRSDGVERTPNQLSTGTREQLYLAIRLAYVLYYCKSNQPLPIVIDDVLVNFDEKRSRQTLAVLTDISKSTQVLFFTCHPHMMNLAREIVPGLKPIELLGNSSRS